MAQLAGVCLLDKFALARGEGGAGGARSGTNEEGTCRVRADQWGTARVSRMYIDGYILFLKLVSLLGLGE